ncbi:hypothetical protein Tco_0191411 [Tanacetum coccineum]
MFEVHNSISSRGRTSNILILLLKVLQDAQGTPTRNAVTRLVFPIQGTAEAQEAYRKEEEKQKKKVSSVKLGRNKDEGRFCLKEIMIKNET